MTISRRAFAGGALAALAVPWRAAAEGVGAAALQADFDELYVRLARAHFDVFAHRSRAAHDALHAQLRARLTTDLPRDDALALFQRFVAFGRVAHARIDGAGDRFRHYRADGGAVFPLELRMKRGRAFVSSTGGAGEVRAGDELLAIEGMPAAALIASLWQDVSADTAYMFAGMVEWDLARLLWQRLGTRRAFEVTVRTADGQPRRATVPARTREALAELAVGGPRLGLASRDRTHRMLAPGLAYLRPGPFYAVETPAAPYDNRAFRAFTDAAFESFLAAGARTLILDLRDNPGGDSSFSDHLVAWFARRQFRFASAFRIRVSPETTASNRARLAVPGNDPTGVGAVFDRLYRESAPGRIVDFPVPLIPSRPGPRFRGRVFALVDRLSYSNTVAVAALIQDHGFGTIIGEETSDLATTYGAMETFALTRTGIAVGYPKARIVRPNGSLAGRGVVPDIAIETPVVEGPEDPVLVRATEIASAR